MKVKDMLMYVILLLVIGILGVMIIFDPFSIISRPPSFTLPFNYTEDANLWVRIVFAPNTICAGDTTQGTITSNMPNSQCEVWGFDGTNFRLVTTVILDSNGYYTERPRFTDVGSYAFTVVCTDNYGRQKRSNDIGLIVNPCGGDNDGDGIPDDIDPDDDNDGIPDTEDPHPFIPDYDTTTTEYSECTSFCTDIGYTYGRGIFDSSGWCDYPETALEIRSGEWCCCGDESTTTTSTYDTTTSIAIYCEAEFPRPYSQKDCSKRTGCAKYESCVFVDGGIFGVDRCECKSSFTTSVSTSVATTTTETTVAGCRDDDAYAGGIDQQKYIPEWCQDGDGTWHNDYCQWDDASVLNEKRCYSGDFYCSVEPVYCEYGCGLDEWGIGYCLPAGSSTSTTITITTTSIIIPSCIEQCQNTGYSHGQEGNFPTNDDCYWWAGASCDSEFWQGLYAYLRISTVCCCYTCNNPV